MATTYTATKLVQLAKSKAVGIHNDHNRSIWHVNPNFDNCS